MGGVSPAPDRRNSPADHNAVFRVFRGATSVNDSANRLKGLRDQAAPQRVASFEKMSYARLQVESQSKDGNFDRADVLRSRNEAAVVRSYCTMPDDRFQRWVDASSAAGAVEGFMVPLVQGLGRFDCHLKALRTFF